MIKTKFWLNNAAFTAVALLRDCSMIGLTTSTVLAMHNKRLQMKDSEGVLIKNLLSKANGVN